MQSFRRTAWPGLPMQWLQLGYRHLAVASNGVWDMLANEEVRQTAVVYVGCAVLQRCTGLQSAA